MNFALLGNVGLDTALKGTRFLTRLCFTGGVARALTQYLLQT